ncbi:MAG: sulfurtransferase TusA family protein [Herpetosiphonaceae bacterium]|nr:sulfurtransferase TusA family protein [Herpetosiphonaceae bacterium]
MSSKDQTDSVKTAPSPSVEAATLVPDVRLDAGLSGCGELTLLIFQAMKQLAPGQTLEVLAYDLAASVDIPAWCRQTRNSLLITDLATRPQRFVIQKQR